MLQIEEATETNNQAELATTTHESQHRLPRTNTNTNYITYGLNIPVTSWSRKDEYQKSVEPKKTVKVSNKKSGYRDENDHLTAPSIVKFCDYVFFISVDPDR